MSKILRRPMFRGGGTVSSYGNGIASGLADGGRVGLESGGKPILGGDLYDRDAYNSFINNYQKNLNKNSALYGTIYNNEGEIKEDSKYSYENMFGDATGKSENPESIFTNVDPMLDYTSTFIPPLGGTEELGVAMKEDILSKLKESKQYNTSEVPRGPRELGLNVNSKIDTSLTNSVLENQNKVSDDSELTLEEIKDSLGGGKAFGRDATDMLLRFSGAEGDTVSEKFKNYAALESKAGPSRTETIDQAAASFMLKDKLQTKRDKAKVDMMRADVDYKISAGKKIDISEGILASTKGGQTTDKKLAIGIQSSTSPTTGNKYVFKGVLDAKDLEQVLKSEQLKTGDTLIVKQTIKDETSGIDKVIKKIIEIQADGTGKEIYKLT